MYKYRSDNGQTRVAYLAGLRKNTFRGRDKIIRAALGMEDVKPISPEEAYGDKSFIIKGSEYTFYSTPLYGEPSQSEWSNIRCTVCAEKHGPVAVCIYASSIDTINPGGRSVDEVSDRLMSYVSSVVSELSGPGGLVPINSEDEENHKIVKLLMDLPIHLMQG
jgi:hypothetical protein